ncbi:MAG: cell division protein ZipA [Xanthomonadales bacterium]|nr:cell division protein ZipA [Xanthomonadales bacterium]
MNMDMQTFRLALIAIGAVIFVIVLMISKSDQRKQKNSKRRFEKKQRDISVNPTAEEVAEEEFDSEQEELGIQQELEALKGMEAMIAADKQPSASVTTVEAASSAAEGLPEPIADAPVTPAANSTPKKVEAKKTPKGPRPDMVVTLYLQSLGKQRVHGTALLEATVKTGLVFGNMRLFHRVPEGSKQSLFSLANGLKPGTFDPTTWGTFETPMLTLFYSLPAPFEGLAAWESMLATANRLASLLDLAVLDNQQMPLNRERIGEIREQLRLYDRNHPK